MSPALLQLLEAWYHFQHCPPAQRASAGATWRRLATDTRAKMPGITHEEFLAALRPHYLAYVRNLKAQGMAKLPPKA